MRAQTIIGGALLILGAIGVAPIASAQEWRGWQDTRREEVREDRGYRAVGDGRYDRWRERRAEERREAAWRERRRHEAWEARERWAHERAREWAREKGFW